MERTAEDRVERQSRRSAAMVGLIAVLLIGAGLGFIAWNTLRSQRAATPIGEILADLRTYDEQLVRVEGTAGETLNVMGFKAFRLSDDTGKILIVTERGLPAEGQKVVVEGYVKQLFEVAGVQMTAIYEAAEGGRQ